MNHVFKGGPEINIDVTGVSLPTLGAGDQLVWTQGLFDNYLGNGTVVTPFYEMDILTAGRSPAGPNPYGPPAYPFQYHDNKFYDQPKARYQAPGSTQAFFDANAYLAVENNGAKTLRVYDGVFYGFQNQPRARGMGPAGQRTAGGGRDPAQNGKGLTSAGGPSVNFARPSPKSR